MSYARCVLVNSHLFIHECVCPTHEATRDDAPTGRQGGRRGGFMQWNFIAYENKPCYSLRVTVRYGKQSLKMLSDVGSCIAHVGDR